MVAGSDPSRRRDVAHDDSGDLGCCFYILAFFSFLVIIVFFPISLIWSVKVPQRTGGARQSRIAAEFALLLGSADCEGL